MEKSALAWIVRVSCATGLAIGSAVAQDKPASTAVPAPEPPPAVVAAPAGPQKVGAAPAWTVTCISPARAVAADCTLEQRLFAKETGRILSIAVVEVPGATRQPTLMVRLPTGLALQEAPTLVIDDTKPQPMAFQSCDANGCYATLMINPALLDTLKTGRVMTVRALSIGHETLAFQHLLTDFPAAYAAAQ